MIDCHAHVIDRQRFPFVHGTYQPHAGEWGTIERFLSVLDAHGVGEAVLVQPTSGYDYDHACLLHALGAAQGRLRGVARVRVDRARTDRVLLKHPLIVGIRLDLMHDGVAAIQSPEFEWLAGVLGERAQIVQVQTQEDQLAQILPVLRKSGLRIVVDHCGRPDPERGPSQPGFASLLELGREGHYVKLSGVFRFSRKPYPHEDADPYIAALLDAFTPQRCVWGSDWPFLRYSDSVDYASTLKLASRWSADPASYDAAARNLFRFPASQ